MNESKTESFNSVPLVSVFYLARKAEGIEALRIFANSYRRHPAGAPHNLVVIYKGFTGQEDIEPAQEIFADILHTTLMLDDVAYDLGSYAMAAYQTTSPLVFCLNTFSEILSPNWLGKILPHIQKPDVGIVGASCSYESTSSSLTLLNKALYFQHLCPDNNNHAVQKYLGFLWNFSPGPTRWRNRVKDLLKKLKNVVLPPKALTDPGKVNWEEWLTSWHQTDKGALDYLLTFPCFPNPHVRSNGFMIRKERLLNWLNPLPVTKFDCAGLECGPDGLTRQLHRQGLNALAVGADGKAYAMEEWPTAGIFRSGEQHNNLVGDNRTREFLAMPPKEKILYQRMSWGDYLLPEPEDFPRFDAYFPKDPSLGGFMIAP